ncbi:MAG: galactofuranosyl transferase [Pseudonocardia sp.]|nr:galactofuranosyl transferase [Pseudonocardia sp.]
MADPESIHAAHGTLLQRVILPRAGDPMTVRALYMDERTGLHMATTPLVPGATVTHRLHLSGSAVTGRRLRVTSRTSACVPEQSEVSFAAYFNAFAAGYWRHWTPLTEVRLRMRLEGTGRVDVYRSKADGSQIHVCGEVLDDPGRHDVDIALDLRPFEDGGWYWFDLTTDDTELTLLEGGWHAAEPASGRAAVAIGMPTFNRPADCVATLTAIGEDPLVLAAVTQVIVPDQGTRKVRDEPGFAPASPCWSAGRCSRCRPARSCRPWARSSTGTASCGAMPRRPTRTTTSPNARCARRRGCTGGWTSTTTPGGCA